jgi:hypothetical protein
MREAMAAFFSTQLDFILFFYGLAFLLLGTTCFGISRGGRGGHFWGVLGLFAVAHGVCEWLDLTALIISDSPAFAVVRIALMTGSFLLLMEFARLNAGRFGLKLQGRWLYPPLVVLVVFGGFMGGLATAGSLARYTIGFVAALATSLVFVWDAKALSGVPRCSPPWDSHFMVSPLVPSFRPRRSGRQRNSTTTGSSNSRESRFSSCGD